MISASEAPYQSCYCEENVYKLFEKIRDSEDLNLKLEEFFAVMISNDVKMIPLWTQKAAREPGSACTSKPQTCENQFICPATIKSIHGRIINVNYDGWNSEFDELYDIDSHDILPVGWCELHNYVLQQPKTDDY